MTLTPKALIFSLACEDKAEVRTEVSLLKESLSMQRRLPGACAILGGSSYLWKESEFIS